MTHELTRREALLAAAGAGAGLALARFPENAFAAEFAAFAAPPELAGFTYPEPRAFIETQDWWVNGQPGLSAPTPTFPFESVHVHLGINFPVGEKLVIPPAGSAYKWDYLAQWHEQNPTGVSRRVRGGGFIGAGSGLGTIPFDPGSVGIHFNEVNVRHAGAIPMPVEAVNAWRAAAPGTYENRFTADTTSKFGKREYQSGAWNAQLNALGSPVAITARGWYEDGEYTNVTLKAKVQAHTLADGTAIKPGQTLSYSLAQGAAFAFAYLNPDIHNGIKGRVLMENKTGSSGTFVLPADLTAGVNVLLLGAWEKRPSGWNAGVLRLPFMVV